MIKRNNNLTDSKITNIDSLYRLEDSGIYEIDTPNNLKSKYSTFTDDQVILEVTATKNMTIQTISAIGIEFIRYRKNNTWTEWESVLFIKNDNNRSINVAEGYNLRSLEDKLQSYINTIRGSDAKNIYVGKQPLYDAREIKQKISNMVPIRREPEMVPIYSAERDVITMKNRDWVRLLRLDTGDSLGIEVNDELSYVIDRNYNNRYKVLSNEDTTYIIGDNKFQRIFFEGHFRPYVEASTFSESGRSTRRSANIMVYSDLDWKWLHNGGRINRAEVHHIPVNEMYYKSTPDFGYSWPQTGTTGSQCFSTSTGTSVVNTNTHPPTEGNNGLLYGQNANLEYVLWR